MALCVKEFGETDVIYIADKEFYSASNTEMLDGEEFQYIIPLRRNNTLIDFSILQQPEFKKKIRFFSYQNRIIWYYSYEKGNSRIVTFLDEQLRVWEENDYLSRVKTHPENYSIDKYYEKLHGFGTISRDVLNLHYRLLRKNRQQHLEKSNAVNCFGSIPIRSNIVCHG